MSLESNGKATGDAVYIESVSEHKSPNGATSPQHDVEELRQREKTLLRKYDKFVLPLVWVLFILSYLDRGNIGNAKTAGAQTALGLTSTQWSWVLLSFYITYTCLEWLVLCWKVFPAHIYVAALCVAWGVVAMCSGLVNSYGGLITCRVFLGIFEAGFGAGVPYYLSLCYKRRELGTRLSILLGSSPIANCFAGAMAYGISNIKSSVAAWRLIFLIEGAPTILIAPVVYFYLMDHPSTAKFFDESERTLAMERMETRDTTKKSSLNTKQIFMGLSDYKNWCHAVLHFCNNYSFAAFSNFLPSILHNMGYDSINAQGLTAPPYLGAFVTSIIAAYISDRYGNRGYIMSFSAAVAAVGYAIIATQSTTGVRYLGVWLACCGAFPSLAINMTWMLNNNAGDTKKGIGMSMLAIIGQCSSFVASFVFPNEDASYYMKGNLIGCALAGVIVPTGLILHFAYSYENKKKDRLYGKVDPNMGPVDVSVEGDKHRNFRLLT